MELSGGSELIQIGRAAKLLLQIKMKLGIRLLFKVSLYFIQIYLTTYVCSAFGSESDLPSKD